MAREIEAAIDPRRHGHAPDALGTEPGVEVGLVPDRPDVHAGELAARRLGEEPKLLGAGAIGAASAASLGRPVRRSSAKAEVRPHAAVADRLVDGHVEVPRVAAGIGAVEAGRLPAPARRDAVPVEVDLHHVGSEGVELVEGRGWRTAELRVVLHDQQLAARGVGSGCGAGRSDEHGDCDRQSFHGATRERRSGQARSKSLSSEQHTAEELRCRRTQWLPDRPPETTWRRYHWVSNGSSGGPG